MNICISFLFHHRDAYIHVPIYRPVFVLGARLKRVLESLSQQQIFFPAEMCDLDFFHFACSQSIDAISGLYTDRRR